MATRAGTAASSLRAKQGLIRLLFGSELSRKGPNAHRMLDHSIYSYAQLRAAYLKRVHELHPDKKKSHEKTTLGANDAEVCNGATSNKRSDASRFLELQEAWNQYENFAKMMKRGNKGNNRTALGGFDANFTMFGVGCSFSDNESERELRNKIMDQASRGWFSAGALDASSGNVEDGEMTADPTQSSKSCRLSSDSLFEEELSTQTKADSDDNSCEEGRERNDDKPRPSLISHLLRSKRK